MVRPPRSSAPSATRSWPKPRFQVADATRLDAFEGRFDTVVDSAFYHVLMGDEAVQTKYVQTLRGHQARGAIVHVRVQPAQRQRPAMGRHPRRHFERVLARSGWRLDYLGATTYLARFGPETFDTMSGILAESQGETVEKMRPLRQQMDALRPLLHDDLVHVPVWSVVATRLD
jgi:hypothetical protein